MWPHAVKVEQSGHAGTVEGSALDASWRLFILGQQPALDGSLQAKAVVRHAVVDFEVDLQALQRDVARTPAGARMLMLGQRPTLDAFFANVDTQPMASASIAQVTHLFLCSCRLLSDINDCITMTQDAATSHKCNMQKFMMGYVNDTNQNISAQVHGARLSANMLQELGWRWRAGPEVVLKVQHSDMRRLMDSDVRNLGRLAAFVRDVMPFDAMPVGSRLLTSPNSLLHRSIQTP